MLKLAEVSMRLRQAILLLGCPLVERPFNQLGLGGNSPHFADTHITQQERVQQRQTTDVEALQTLTGRQRGLSRHYLKQNLGQKPTSSELE